MPVERTSRRKSVGKPGRSRVICSNAARKARSPSRASGAAASIAFSRSAMVANADSRMAT